VAIGTVAPRRRRPVAVSALLTVVLAAVLVAPSAATEGVGDAHGPTVRVAYPDVPATWSGLDERDTAALDLFALWGLPLLRVDHAGQVRPALATGWRHVEVDGAPAVELDLAPGRWSDGEDVTADDVVATATALADARPEAWVGVTVTAVDAHTIRLAGELPAGRWPYLLAGAPGVLPEHVLAGEGLAAYADGVPVSGGWFTLAEHEPGRRSHFVAHPDGPLGPPGTGRLEIDTVPSFETALGLLDRGEVDVVLGHLAVNPVARAVALDGVEAGAPLGGTYTALAWHPDGVVGDDPAMRRGLADALELSRLVRGLLGPIGAPATSPVPAVEGPWGASSGREPDRDVTPPGDELVLLLPRWHEALGFTARVVQGGIRATGASMAVVSHESPRWLDPPEHVDVALRAVRSLPRPVLGEGVGDHVPPGPVGAVASELAAGFEALRQDETLTPLYRIGVAHAWAGVDGVRPSSWPGLAFWDAGAWRPQR
jgi:hypothetical protein